MSKQNTKKTENEENKGRSRRRLKPAHLILGIAAGVVLLLGVFYILNGRGRSFSEARIISRVEIGSAGAARVSAFAGGFLRYSRDGISMLTTDGKEKWNISYNMNQPRLVIGGDYGAVGDLAGRKVVVFGKSGLCGSYTTTFDIMSLSISGGGVSAVSLDKGAGSLIQFYEKSGERLDIEMSFELTMSGYPLALALSPDGNGLAVSFVNSSTGALNTQLAFYNFSVGKSEPDRLIGYFRYEEQLMPQVDYLSATRVVAVTDTRLEFLSLEQENKPTVLKSVTLPAGLSHYQTGSDHAALIYPDPATGRQTLSVYKSDGSLCFSRELGGSLLSLALEDAGVLILTDSGFSLVNYQGKERFNGSLAHSGQALFLQGSREIIQFDGSHITRYRLR